MPAYSGSVNENNENDDCDEEVDGLVRLSSERRRCHFAPHCRPFYLQLLFNLGVLLMGYIAGYYSVTGFGGIQVKQSVEIKCYHPVRDILYNMTVSLRPESLSLKSDRTGSLQGLAVVDGSSSNTIVLYVGYMHALRKLVVNRDTLTVHQVVKERLYNQSIDFPGVPLANGTVSPIAHFGGIDVVRTPNGTEVLFASHTLIENKTIGGGIVVGVDGDSLEFDGTTVAHNPSAANDWVAVDATSGIGYTGAFFNVTHAMRFRTDTFEDLEPLNFSGRGLPVNGINFIQSATIHGSSLLLATDDFQGSMYFVDLQTGRVQGRQSLLLGNEMDGLVSISEDRLLVGYNRWPHEKKHLHSIVLLQAQREILDTGSQTACGGGYIHFADAW